ncbi:hypothetical protein Mal64_33990 [Pseudobythopirellula maris]|uniref:Uncharacterized protein n=1 Tax=Pseudobythopirellula maris TaxID=2527991 RepID=A0A5C5ZJ73_9BACT|nr:hypothetical protein [Pseudobythopirellula maris]TWT86573.1 hypothetical protein Mal64_33990 [Pseudobythopirellula maris]
MDSPTPPDSDPLDAQQALVENSLALLFETYDTALSDGVKDPVVLLVDCEDDLGAQIACGWLGEEAVDDAIAMQHAEAADAEAELDTTVYARAFAWRECQQELPSAFPYLADVFAGGPPVGGFLAVGVAAGGASALTVPEELREEL